MSPPIIDKFLGEIAWIIKEQNGAQLQNFLIIEPPLPPLYNQIVNELRQAYPTNSHAALENKCTAFIPEIDESEDGGSRSSFITFMVKYFAFLRDVNVDNLVETHDMLKALLKYVFMLSIYGMRSRAQNYAVNAYWLSGRLWAWWCYPLSSLYPGYLQG